jgi:F-type H+-transporting ATPase subunit b
MSLLLPQFGLFFWTLVIFLIVLFVLRKVAWKPIMKGLRDREQSIENSLAEAAAARDEMSRLKADNERILAEARAERDLIIKEANAARDRMVTDAKREAQLQADKLLADARAQIDLEKKKAIAEVRATASSLALNVAERVLRKEFESRTAQQSYAESLVVELSSN